MKTAKQILIYSNKKNPPHKAESSTFAGGFSVYSGSISPPLTINPTSRIELPAGMVAL